MASILIPPDATLEAYVHCCSASQVQELLTRTPRERLRTHGHMSVARSMEANKDPLGVMSVLLKQPEIQVNLPEFGGDEGNTLLHLAVSMHDEDNEENCKDFVSLILQRADVDLNVRNRRLDTPLHLAARVPSTLCVNILLSDPRSNVTILNKNKQTCLHVACEASSTKTTDQIARKIMDSARLTVKSFPQFLRKQDEFGNTGLHYAAARGLENVVDAFFEADNKDELAVKQNYHGNLAIHLAAKNGHHGVVERMLVLLDDSHVHNVVLNIEDQDGFGLLHHAVRSGCIKILQLCIDRLPKPTRPTLTLDLYVELLAVARHRDVADSLLKSLEKIVKGKEGKEGKEDDYLSNLLHFAATSEKGETLVGLIVKWYPKQAVVAMHEALEKKNKTIQAMLRDHPEVQLDFVKLHRKYTYYVTAANAILVVSVLIITLTHDKCLTSEFEGSPGIKKVQGMDFFLLPKWAFVQAIVATILAAFAALPFSFAFFFHEAVDDTQVKQLLYKTRVLIVSASYFLMLSLEALFFSFLCSQFIAPYIDKGCVIACEVALSVFFMVTMLFLGFNFVQYWRTRKDENRRGPTRDHEDGGELEMLMVLCEPSS